MTRHPNPELFAARLDDLCDLHRGQLAHDLSLANERGSLLDEVNLQARTYDGDARAMDVLRDLMDDLDGDAASDAHADLAAA